MRPTYVAYTASTATKSGYGIVLVGERGESREAVISRAKRIIRADDRPGFAEIPVADRLQNLHVAPLSVVRSIRQMRDTLREFEERHSRS